MNYDAMLVENLWWNAVLRNEIISTIHNTSDNVDVTQNDVVHVVLILLQVTSIQNSKRHCYVASHFTSSRYTNVNVTSRHMSIRRVTSHFPLLHLVYTTSNGNRQRPFSVEHPFKSPIIK